jgi:hypothetical protein
MDGQHQPATRARGGFLVVVALAPQRVSRWTEDLALRSFKRHVEVAPLLLSWRAKRRRRNDFERSG